MFLKIYIRMKKYMILVCSLFTFSGVFAQGEYDAMKYSQTDITGSARYVGMAGAFGALGGDMSAIGMNPAGIAVYRSSELSFTPVFTNATTSTDFFGSSSNDSRLKIQVNNFGYVGSFRTSEKATLSNFNFGISYNRLKDFNRNVSISGKERRFSLLDRVCEDLGSDVSENNLDGIGWLAYQTYLTNRESNGHYTSVLAPGETMNTNMYLQEKGGIDEWQFSVGANWAHFLYVGASVNFQDLNYDLKSTYKEESLDKLFGFQMNNALVTDGGGVNAKIGAIIRPIPNLRFGFAIHTPTYYYLTDTYGVSMSSKGVTGDGTDEHYADISGDNCYSNYELITPGKLLYSVAYQFGKKGLISMDWDIIDYRDAKLKSEDGVPYEDSNSDMYNHLRATKNFRIGGEYRLNDNISLRAGTAWYQSAYKTNITSKNPEIITAGTTPQYSFDTGTRYTSLGIGYRTGSFFMDFALINQKSSENFFNFFDSGDHTQTKYATVDTNKANLNVSMGFRF
jgi:long-subunit fatty acid transport protein